MQDATIDFTYSCPGWVSGGTVQFYVQGSTPTNIGDPITIPNISLTSYQFSGSITYAFPAAGTFVVDAKVVGTVDSGAGSACDIAAVNSGTAVTFTVSEAVTTTIVTDGMPIAQTGADPAGIVMAALLLLTTGGLLVVRRRIS
jgi:LPXTG-motif cell wall-anchored protein